MKTGKLTGEKLKIKAKKNTLFHEKMKELRSIYGMSQKDVSKVLLVSKQTISNYETGFREPSLDSLIKIADFFHVSADWLIGRNTSNDVDPANVLMEIKEKMRLEKIAKLRQELADLEGQK